MAHSNQARKRIRQDEKRNTANRTQVARMRSMVKALETAITAGDRDTVPQAFKNAMSALHQNARKGLISRNAAARKISRLSARVNKSA